MHLAYVLVNMMSVLPESSNKSSTLSLTNSLDRLFIYIAVGHPQQAPL